MPYKLLSYYASPKEIRAGVLVDDMVYDAARVGTNTAYADMMGVLDDWKKAKKALADGVKLIEAGKSRAKGGTGLGLAIVKHIVNRHRGRLTIESEPGQGSTFKIALPVLLTEG